MSQVEQSQIAETTENAEVNLPQLGLRWWPAAAIVGIAVLIEGVIWFTNSEDRSIQAGSMWLTSMSVVALLLLWWTLASRVRWKTRLIGLGVALLFAVGGRLLLRVEELTGAVYPKLAFRWSDTAEEAAANYRRSADVQTVTPSELVVTAGDWTEFRGPNRTGVVEDAAIRRNWQEHLPRQIWRHPVGRGWSSFIVVGGRAFTQEQRFEEEAVVCYDAQSGHEIWAHTDMARFSEAMGNDGPRATPTYFEGMIYAQGATGILNCLDAGTGKLIWGKNIVKDNGAELLGWGMSGSPLVFDDLVVVNAGGPNGHGLVAYDRLTGERRWSGGDDKASYSSPQLNELHGLRQVLIFDAEGLAGHDTADGTQLWKFPWKTNVAVNATQPYLADDSTILISNGYGVGSTLLQINRDDHNWSVKQLWKSNRLKAKFNDFVVKDGFVYGLDEGVLACLSLESGKRQWKGGRYGYGQILLVDDVILVLSESGEVSLVEAQPERHKKLTQFQAIEGKTWNHPVLVRGRLFVRNAREAACYDISIEDQSRDFKSDVLR